VRLQEQAAQADHSLSFSFRVPAILVVLVAGLAVRLLLATFPGFGIDVGTFQAWSFQLADRGPWNFYDTDSFTDYSPGYLYLLWAIGELHQIFHFTNGQYEYILKLPSIVADLASAYLLYRVLEVRRKASGGSLARLSALSSDAVYRPDLGSSDSLLAFFFAVERLYFIGRDRPVPARSLSWSHSSLNTGYRGAAIPGVLDSRVILRAGSLRLEL
jgi:Gpi18-like mannosyltransferase